jgi:hypothetical protein
VHLARKPQDRTKTLYAIMLTGRAERPLQNESTPLARCSFFIGFGGFASASHFHGFFCDETGFARIKFRRANDKRLRKNEPYSQKLGQIGCLEKR